MEYIMSMPEIYVSTDIETNGPAPGIHSMLSFASAAYLADKTLISTFSANLTLLPNTISNPDTMKFWEDFPQAYAACRTNLQDPEIAIPAYVQWVKDLPGKPAFLAYPAGFDFSFMYYYMHRFAGESPFSCTAIDIRSYAMAMQQSEFREILRRTLPPEWFEPNIPHTHIALDDAIEQGLLFCNMLAINRKRE